MEPIAFFIETFITLADRIGNIEKTRLLDKQSLFNEIAKPLFEDLEPVAQNYIHFFQETRKVIKKGALESVRGKIDLIKENRDEMIMHRIRIRETSEQICDYIKDNDFVEFANTVNNFFYSTPDLPLRKIEEVTTTHELILLLEQLSSGELSKKQLIQYMDEKLVNIKTSWGLIVKSYEKLKIHSVISPKFVRKLAIHKKAK